MNVINCRYKSMAQLNIINWPYYGAVYGLHVRKDPNLAWFQTNHTVEHSMVEMALRQFGPKTNSDGKPDSDQRQIQTQFWNSAQIISLINLIT